MAKATSDSITGTSTKTPTTVARAAPEFSPNRLIATATEISLTGRSGIYDVTVTNQDNQKIAEFRGISRAINGTLFDEN